VSASVSLLSPWESVPAVPVVGDAGISAFQMCRDRGRVENAAIGGGTAAVLATKN
jgi:hypothetical protein